MQGHGVLTIKHHKYQNDNLWTLCGWLICFHHVKTPIYCCTSASLNYVLSSAVTEDILIEYGICTSSLQEGTNDGKECGHTQTLNIVYTFVHFYIAWVEHYQRSGDRLAFLYLSTFFFLKFCKLVCLSCASVHLQLRFILFLRLILFET